MKILLVEDAEDKRNQVISALKEKFEFLDIKLASSISTALEFLFSPNDFELVILDMSLPTFELANSSSEAGAEAFGGIEILNQMYFMGIELPVVVLTQYRSFDGGKSYDQLSKELETQFESIVREMIYYDYPGSEWLLKVSKYLREV